MAAAYDREQFAADYQLACQKAIQAYWELVELQQRAIDCHFDDEIALLADADTQWDSTLFTKGMYQEADSGVTQLRNYWTAAAVAPAAYGEKLNRVANAVPADAQSFSQQQVERIESSLGQADNENLELITRRIIQTQAAAETSVSQIQVTMPACGQVLRFDSPLQVEPAAEMGIAFTAKPQQLARIDPSLWYGLGLFAILFACSFVLSRMRGPWARLCEALAPVTGSVRTTTPAVPDKSAGPEDRDDRNRRVSAEDLL